MEANFTTTMRPLQPNDRGEVDLLLRAMQNFTDTEIALAHVLMDAIVDEPDRPC